MRRCWLIPLSAIIALAFSVSCFAQDPMAPRDPHNPGGDTYLQSGHRKDKKRKPSKTRSVSGAVTNANNNIVEGAVVQLKNTKTLRVRSYITLADGVYRFHGLSTEIDYDLRATYEGASSKTRRLSIYDSRKKAIIDLKLKPKS